MMSRQVPKTYVFRRCRSKRFGPKLKKRLRRSAVAFDMKYEWLVVKDIAIPVSEMHETVSENPHE